MRSNNNLTQRELAARARLSSYHGSIGRRTAPYEGSNLAYGSRRPAGYAGQFATESDIHAMTGTLTFQISVVNAAVATRTFRLTPALLGESAPGLIALGAFNDIDAAAGLTGSTTSSGTIAQFIRMYLANPTSLRAIKFVSTVDGQASLTVNAFVASPFRQLESKVIPLSQYNDGNTFNNKIIFADLLKYNLQLDTQSDIRIPVAASSTLDLTLFIGPILNTAQILADRTQV